MKPSELSDEFILCRDLRHHWALDPLNDLQLGKRDGVQVLERQLECQVCGTIQSQTISLTTFKVVARSYSYPDGFLLGEPATFAQIRETSVRRQLKTLRARKKVTR